MGTTRQGCTSDCFYSTSPASTCECACGGEHHGQGVQGATGTPQVVGGQVFVPVGHGDSEPSHGTEFLDARTGYAILQARVHDLEQQANRAYDSGPNGPEEALAIQQGELADARREADAYAKHALGDVSNVQEGSRTPWGTADHVSHPAPGIVFASTSSHGGIKLSPERNRMIPPALRQSSGWYEEDYESNIVGMYYPEAFPHYKDGDNQAIMDSCAESVKNTQPDEYEQATGQKVTPEESRVLRERIAAADREAVRAEHRGSFVSDTSSNHDSHADWIPEGYAILSARNDETGEERTFLLPKDEVYPNHRRADQVIIDPERHMDVTDVMNAEPDGPSPYRGEGPKIHGDDIGISYVGLTAAQEQRAFGELNKRYRFRDDDGREHVETLGDHFKRVGLTGKTQMDGEPGKFYVEFGNSRVMPVSKATFDALSGVPDSTTERTRVYLKLTGARKTADRNPTAENRAKVDALTDQHKRLRDAEDAESSAWQAQRAVVKQQTFDRLRSVAA